MSTLPLTEIESVPTLRDHWLAIDTTGRVRPDQTPLRLRSGAIVVDADAELDVLCRRISEQRRTSLTIVFAG